MATNKIILIRNAQQYDFGGGERFPVFVAEILQSLNYNPLVISRSARLLAFAHEKSVPTIRGWWWSQQNWSGKRILLFPVYLIWQILLTAWYLTVFARHNPDAIHIQSKDDFVAGTVAGRLLRKRIIWTDHADLKHVWRNVGVWYKNPVGKLVLFAAGFADTISVVSKSEQKLISAHLNNTSRIRAKLRVIYNGVLDTASAYAVKKNEATLTFCVASRLVVDKGIREVIEAYKVIADDIPSSQLVLMGDGPDAQMFHELAHDTPSIHFLGHQNDPLQIMSEADVFVHPTYHEGFSVALVEASMLSLPIIATDVGGNVEIIHDNQTGILIPARDSTLLATAMQKLAKDSKLREKLGRTARQQYVERFQFDHIVKEQFLPLYGGENS